MGCATRYYDCQLPGDRLWQRLTSVPTNYMEILADTEKRDRTLILEDPTAEWYGGNENSYIVCLPGEAQGVCAKSKEWRETGGCGQFTFEFERTDGGWSAPEETGVICTCDPKRGAP